MIVYLLWHVHEITDDFGTHEDEKLIGIFSSEQKANETIQHFKNLEGFRDCPSDCFIIDKYEVDKPDWTEGFITVHWNES